MVGLLTKLRPQVCLLLLAIAVVVYLYWKGTPEQKVFRLLAEVKSLPRGKFEVSYFGRSHSQIQGWQ